LHRRDAEGASSNAPRFCPPLDTSQPQLIGIAPTIFATPPGKSARKHCNSSCKVSQHHEGVPESCAASSNLPSFAPAGSAANGSDPEKYPHDGSKQSSLSSPLAVDLAAAQNVSRLPQDAPQSFLMA